MNFFRPFTAVAMAGLVCLMTSCDKVKGLADKVMSWTGDDEAGEQAQASGEVETVGEKDGKEIIENETRLVVLEFYSDT